MKHILTLAGVLVLTAVVPTLTDIGSVRSTQSRHLFLAGANFSSRGAPVQV